ncbi:MAG: hypothetical protein ACXAAT_01820 [Candidatus Hodarchaeales archaeon]
MTEKISFPRYWRRYVFFFGMIANFQFVILSFIAMVFYRGGFSFSTDPLSALGFTRVAGESNLVSSLIFNTSMFLVGISVILLFPTMLSFFKDDPIEKFFSSAGSIFAIFSGIAMCGAALTPGDINFEAHIVFAPFTFLFGLLMVFFYIIPLVKNTGFSKRYSIVLVVYTVFVVITLVVLYLGSTAYDLEGSIIQIITQKIAIYTEVFVLFVLSYGTWKLQKTQD